MVRRTCGSFLLGKPRCREAPRSVGLSGFVCAVCASLTAAGPGVPRALFVSGTGFLLQSQGVPGARQTTRAMSLVPLPTSRGEGRRAKLLREPHCFLECAPNFRRLPVAVAETFQPRRQQRI